MREDLLRFVVSARRLEDGVCGSTDVALSGEAEGVERVSKGGIRAVVGLQRGPMAWEVRDYAALPKIRFTVVL